MRRMRLTPYLLAASACLLWLSCLPALAHDDEKAGYHIHVKGRAVDTSGKPVAWFYYDYDTDNLFPAFEGKCYAAPKAKGGGWFGGWGRTDFSIPGLPQTGWDGEYEIIYPVKNTTFCLSKFPTAMVDRSKIMLFKPEKK